ncbi:PQQ-dependent sugar dehydrogenase [Myxococcota bacterium]|nr:PQQ-dependent sugar dehydrogenase [Myxococcota bacterium]
MMTALGATRAEAQTVADANFSAQVLYRGNGMITVGFGPDGRMYVCEKQGRILLFLADGHGGFQTPTVFADLTAVVDDAQEMGLLGLALDPSFATNRHMFLFYSTATDQRVVRIEADASYGQMVAGSELVLVSGLPRNVGNLKGGAIELHPNEPDVLYIGVGVDSFPGGATNLTLYNGKILRVNKATGAGLLDNPYQNGVVTSVQSRLWAIGLRNPFRFTFHPNAPVANVLYLSENGQATDRLSWVLRGSNGAWGPLGDTGGFLSPPDPNHHVMLTSAPFRLGVAVTRGGPFADPAFPGSDVLYEGRGLTTGTGNVLRWRLTGDNLDTLAPITQDAGAPFISNAMAIDLRFGPDGSLYMTNTGANASLSTMYPLVRVRYNGGLAPTAAFSATPSNGPAPLEVAFTDASIDPEGTLVGWSWDFGDGTTSIARNPTHTYVAPGTYAVTLTVTDSALKTGTTALSVIVTEADACTPDPGCDDGDACNGVETCDPLVGCLPGAPLACDDGDACNGVETCSPSTGCVPGTAPTCDDGNVCSADACDVSTGCQSTPVADGTGCGDGDACNGVEVCLGGLCVGGVPATCDDGDACNGVESCDVLLGCTPGTPISCDDGDACNGVETCDPSGACLSGAPVCSTLVVAPASLAFSAVAGGASPASASITLSSGGPAPSLTWSATADATWLSVSPASGTATATASVLAVSIDTTGLGAGSYAASIAITAPDAPNAPISVPVSLVVVQPGLSLSCAPSSQSIAQGSTQSSVCTVSPVDGFTGTVTFGCSGLPAGVTCAFNPTSVTLTDGAPGAVNVFMSNSISGTTSFATSLRVDATGPGASASATMALVLPPCAAASTPVTLTPANGATAVSRTPTLSWQTSTNATSYQLQVATDSTFTNVVRTYSTTATSIVVEQPLVDGVTYFWRVGALTLCNTRTAPVVASFSTGPATTSREANGDFEEGTTSWTQTGTGLVTNATTNTPHGGSWYAQLGGSHSSVGNVYQVVHVPADATAAALTFWLRTISEDNDPGCRDQLSVDLRTSAQVFLGTLYIGCNSFFGPNTWRHAGPFDLTAYRGQDLIVRFYATTDATRMTTFLIDDVVFAADGQ